MTGYDAGRAQEGQLLDALAGQGLLTPGPHRREFPRWVPMATGLTVELLALWWADDRRQEREAVAAALDGRPYDPPSSLVWQSSPTHDQLAAERAR